MKRTYEVVVGNLGTIHQGANRAEAIKRYNTYVSISKSGSGRAGHEEVTLMLDGDILKNYSPAQYNIYWSPEGRVIATVWAENAHGAKKQTPKPYSKFLGESLC